ncbi:MAG: N-acetyltransferase [Planctomycetaceae bacterium]
MVALIRPCSTAADQRAFFQIARDIYRDEPIWVPPIWRVQEELVGFRKHPFYETNRCQAFIAQDGNKTLGRIVAIHNQGHNERYKDKLGFFGFFECIDDPAVSRLLVDAAVEWLRQRGLTAVRGPVNPSLNYDCGLLIDGFDSPPTFMIPYNRDYYQKLLVDSGFAKVQDLFSYDADMSMLETLDPKLGFVIDEATKRFNVKCRPLDRKRLTADVRTFLDIYNQSLQGTWGYVPMSEGEVKHQAAGLKLLLVPELTSIAEIDGRPVGAGFGLLDFNPIIKRIGGKLFPFGWFYLLTGKRKLKRLRLISTNVLPEYQKWGLGLVTLSRILPDAIDYGIEVGEFSWVLESNSLSRNTIERAGGRRTKVLRIFDKSIDSEPAA